MLDEDQTHGSQGDRTDGARAPDPDPANETPAPTSTPAPTPAPSYDESIVEEIGALIDDAGLYAAAEIAFQKTRAKLAGRNIGIAVVFVVVALVLLHIALIAMAVGLVLALAPLVTIWGAIAIVVGVMLLGVGALVYGAIARGKVVAEMFAKDDDPAGAAQGET